ncbi:unnamed protein product [Brassica oleracea var. botrytis]|uniref:Uncharacterized protein n=1 Tax=Brassica oleracea TaxID=3712 RepID=A0A3P6B1X1_BRAOL|nr:unnamed protein product [Brassica oleracea]
MRWFTAVHDSEEEEPAGGGKGQAAGGKSHYGWKRKARGGCLFLRFRFFFKIWFSVNRFG